MHNLANFLFESIIIFLVLILSIVLHEFAHALVAFWLGDPTPRYRGRLSLNPLVHLDPFFSLILPLILILSGSRFVFGIAKPVPVTSSNFEDPIRDMAYVGIAGPTANFLLAALAGFLLRLSSQFSLPGIFIFKYILTLNVVLGVFNLVPVPPLDGSRLLKALLPPKLAYKYGLIEPYGFLILILLLTIFSSFFWFFIGPLINFLIKFFSWG